MAPVRQKKKLFEPLNNFQCHLHIIRPIVVVAVIVSFVAITFKLLSSNSPMTSKDNSNLAGFTRCKMKGDDWLNRENFYFNNSAYDWTTLVSTKQNPCPLNHYTVGNVVACIDSINHSKLRIGSSDNLLHFVFVGDSRARQQFYNFLKFIPEYDRQHEPLSSWSNNSDFHTDRSVTIPLLGLRVSFLWRPELTDNWITDIQSWINNPPYFIFISVGIYHLRPIVGHQDQMEPFERMMTQFLVPKLQSLANIGTDLIWLNQYPVLLLEHITYFLGEWSATTSENFHKVNNLIRKLLKKSGVKVWDSGNAPTEEYIRSCQQWTDRQPLNEVIFHNPYFNCLDRIHPGYAALNHAMQILLNHICNHHLINE